MSWYIAHSYFAQGSKNEFSEAIQLLIEVR